MTEIFSNIQSQSVCRTYTQTWPSFRSRFSQIQWMSPLLLWLDHDHGLTFNHIAIAARVGGGGFSLWSQLIGAGGGGFSLWSQLIGAGAGGNSLSGHNWVGVGGGGILSLVTTDWGWGEWCKAVRIGGIREKSACMRFIWHQTCHSQIVLHVHHLVVDIQIGKASHSFSHMQLERSECTWEHRAVLCESDQWINHAKYHWAGSGVDADHQFVGQDCLLQASHDDCQRELSQWELHPSRRHVHRLYHHHHHHHLALSELQLLETHTCTWINLISCWDE